MLTMLMHNDEEIWINPLLVFTDRPSPESCYVRFCFVFFFFFKLGITLQQKSEKGKKKIELL